jgi:hypothetical protein
MILKCTHHLFLATRTFSQRFAQYAGRYADSMHFDDYLKQGSLFSENYNHWNSLSNMASRVWFETGHSVSKHDSSLYNLISNKLWMVKAYATWRNLDFNFDSLSSRSMDSSNFCPLSIKKLYSRNKMEKNWSLQSYQDELILQIKYLQTWIDDILAQHSPTAL